jgi:branched-chain amino acid transport system substrate-binding protein
MRALATLACLAAAAVAGCGGSGDDRDATLTIYSSQPLQGATRAAAESLVNAEKLALREAGGKAGRFKIRYIALDDATAQSGNWDPGVTSANARRAARDDSAIAYLGEYNSGASAVSVPILNEAGLLQVSPASTYIGLTRSEGAAPDEPDKYYPTGRRTFARIAPGDHVQAAAIASYQREVGCQRLYLVHDKEVYGQGLATEVSKAARRLGMRVLGEDGLDVKAINFRSTAARVADSGADCLFFGGITANKAVQVWRDMHAAAPALKLFGSSGVAEAAFTKDLGAAEKVTYLVDQALPPERYPRAAQRFFAAYRQTYGRDPEAFAIFAYEAMKAVLEAIRAAGDDGDDRQAVVDRFFAIRDRDSVLGRYSVRPDGDTTLTQFAGDRVRDGELRFDRVITPR